MNFSIFSNFTNAIKKPTVLILFIIYSIDFFSFSSILPYIGFLPFDVSTSNIPSIELAASWSGRLLGIFFIVQFFGVVLTDFLANKVFHDKISQKFFIICHIIGIIFSHIILSFCGKQNGGIIIPIIALSLRGFSSGIPNLTKKVLFSFSLTKSVEKINVSCGKLYFDFFFAPNFPL
jgi:MFS family permease